MGTRRGFMAMGLAGAAGLAVLGPSGEAAAAVPARTLVLPAKPAVLLIGDSYTEGVGAVPKTNGFANKIAAPLGWSLTFDGKGGSGYCNPTTYKAGDYATRLGKRTGTYDLVVLQGGSNDEKTVNGVPVYDDVMISTAIATTLATCRTRFPTAQILIMGPANPYGSAGADRVRVNNLIKAAAAANAIPYLDTVAEKWFQAGDGAVFANADNGHPNNAGHGLLRSLFVRDYQLLTGA